MERGEPRHLHAITLRTVKYNDRHNILWLYTLEMGRVNVLVPAGSGRSSSVTRSLTQPLCLLQFVARQGRGGLMKAAEMRPDGVFHSLRCDPAKIAVSLFIAEFLSVVLTEGESDSRLYSFIVQTVRTLDGSTHSIANFHLAFLLGLAAPLGIAPDMISYRPGRIFDMVDATFRDSVPLHTPHWLSVAEGEALVLLSRMTVCNCHRFAFSRSQRGDTLDRLLQYYTLHYRSLNNLRTLPVLHALYD